MHEGRNLRDANRASGGQALESRVSSKDSCPVWGGAVGKGLVQASTSLAAYSTLVHPGEPGPLTPLRRGVSVGRFGVHCEPPTTLATA